MHLLTSKEVENENDDEDCERLRRELRPTIAGYRLGCYNISINCMQRDDFTAWLLPRSFLPSFPNPRPRPSSSFSSSVFDGGWLKAICTA